MLLTHYGSKVCFLKPNQMKKQVKAVMLPTEDKMYSREEVETIILSIVNDVAHDEDLIHHYDGDFRNAKEWIKENI